MSTLLIVLTCIVGYVAAGALYGRSQTIACLGRAKSEWNDETNIRESMRSQIAWRVIFWPWAVVFDSIRGPVAAWFDQPIEHEQARAAELYAEAARYDELIRDCTNDVDRNLMRQGQSALRAQARRHDINGRGAPRRPGSVE